MTGYRSVARTLVVVGIAALVAPGMTLAQDAPQTGWGAPDLQGVWDFRTLTPLQRPEDLGDKAFLTAEEAAQREQAAIDRNEELLLAPAQRTEAGGNLGAYNNFWMDRGTTTVDSRRTSLITDPPNGRIPPVTDEGRERATRVGSFNVEMPESYTDLSNADRCITGFNAGPPITPGGYNQNVQIFQTENHVALMTEMVHTVRVIPINGQAGLDDAVRQWSGDSRGHWEGDTLVVETENFLDHNVYATWRGSSTDMKLVERFTRLDEDTLVYEFTVSDPATWEASWTAQHEMKLNDLPMFEYACHEGNYSMPQMLGGARSIEAREAGQ